MMPITDAQIREWEKACEKATPNWRKARISMRGEALLQMGDDDPCGAFRFRSVQLAENDVDFAEAARTALPLLLAERRRWEEGLKEIENVSGDDEVPPHAACDLIGKWARNLLAGRAWDGTEVG